MINGAKVFAEGQGSVTPPSVSAMVVAAVDPMMIRFPLDTRTSAHNECYRHKPAYSQSILDNLLFSVPGGVGRLSRIKLSEPATAPIGMFKSRRI